MGHLGWLYKLNLHSRYQFCTDEAQKAETVPSAVIHITSGEFHTDKSRIVLNNNGAVTTMFNNNAFKTRWRNHQMLFKNESKKNDTELSKHLWQLKDQKKDFAISWKILAKAKSYSNLTKRSNLFSTEKFYVVYKLDMATLVATIHSFPVLLVT